MDKGIKGVNGELELAIISSFPLLKEDADFMITSPDTENYNCIAWAYMYNDRWMWPGGVECSTLEGFHYWPNDEDSPLISSFIKAFEEKGYKVCDSWKHEDGFRKIALYEKDGVCTHAARELVGNKKTTGKWTSKLGKAHDIQHGTPFSIEGDYYGKAVCFMKQPFP